MVFFFPVAPQITVCVKYVVSIFLHTRARVQIQYLYHTIWRKQDPYVTFRKYFEDNLQKKNVLYGYLCDLIFTTLSCIHALFSCYLSRRKMEKTEKGLTIFHLSSVWRSHSVIMHRFNLLYRSLWVLLIIKREH